MTGIMFVDPNVKKIILRTIQVKNDPTNSAHFSLCFEILFPIFIRSELFFDLSEEPGFFGENRRLFRDVPEVIFMQPHPIVFPTKATSQLCELGCFFLPLLLQML